MITIITVTGMLLLTAIFLSHRDADVGRLPVLIGAFFASLLHHRVFTLTGLIESGAGVIAASLVVLAWYGLGDMIERLGHRLLACEGGKEGRALVWARTCALGAGFWSLLWLALGLAGLYRQTVAVAALLFGLAFFAVSLVQSMKARRLLQTLPGAIATGHLAGRQKTPIEYLAAAFAALPCLLAFVVALAPPTGKDALVYRLALPKAYLAAGGIIDTPYNIYSYLAMGAEMNGVWAMLLGGMGSARIAEIAFGVSAFAYLPLLLAVVYGWAREMKLERGWALVAAALIATIPTVYQVAATGYVDHALALYSALVIHAAGQWWTTQSRWSLLSLSLALGFALCIKLVAVFLCPSLVILILLKAREAQNRAGEAAASSAGHVILSGCAALVCAGITASPWYLKTWLATGSPLFPFYVHLWPGASPGWDAERSRLFQLFLSYYGGAEKTVLDYLLTPVRVSLQAQPELPVYYDGVLGIAFLSGLPLLLWGFWRLSVNVELKIAAAFAAVFFFCWLGSSQQLRFLLPVFPGLAVAMVFMAVTASARSGKERVLPWTLLVATVAGQLTIISWFLEQNPVRAAWGGESRQTYLERRLDYYPYYEIINTQLPLDARIWLINMRNDTYHLDRPYFSDYIFEDYTLTKLVKEAKDLSGLRARVRAMGITHLLIRHDVLLDYDRSPLVDERRERAENQAKLALLRAFLLEGTRLLRSDEKFILVELALQGR
jgi:hypothetical protein